MEREFLALEDSLQQSCEDPQKGGTRGGRAEQPLSSSRQGTNTSMDSREGEGQTCLQQGYRGKGVEDCRQRDLLRNKATEAGSHGTNPEGEKEGDPVASSPRLDGSVVRKENVADRLGTEIEESKSPRRCYQNAITGGPGEKEERKSRGHHG